MVSFSLVQAADFPIKDLSGIIMWGAGGATDNVARAVTPLLEKHLGKQIILQNKPGATGAVCHPVGFTTSLRMGTPSFTARRIPSCTRFWIFPNWITRIFIQSTF